MPDPSTNLDRHLAAGNPEAWPRVTDRVLAARPSRLRCAWCRDDLGPAALTCPACRTLVHEDCELDACPTLGCGSLATWELVGPPRGALAARAAVVSTLLVAAVAALVVWWPHREPPVVEGPVRLPARARPVRGPDPDVPDLDPWFWWSPGAEVVVRTRLHQVNGQLWSGYACCGSGPGVHTSGIDAVR